MKVIDLAEAKDNLEKYGRECHDTPIVVVVNGKPAFEISPLFGNDDEDFLGRLMELSHEFQELIQQRDSEKQRGETLSHEEMLREVLAETI